MRRGPADPVRELMHRHRRLCAGAVDPLEIAAGLEARGMTDRTAAGCRHRDVFSLAEELFARVPREAAGTARPAAAAEPDGPDGTERPVRRRALRRAAHLLPALLCAGGLLACRLLGGDPVQAAVLQAAVVALTAVAVAVAVRCGPLRAPAGRVGSGAGWLWTCWLLAFALFGSRAFGALLGTRAFAALPGPGAPHPAGSLLPAQPGGSTALPDPATAAAFLGWALAVPAAAWGAGRFARRVRAHLAGSRRPTEFSARVRAALAGVLAAFTVLLAALIAGAFALLARGAAPQGTVLGGAVALGLLLFAARLLAVHGAGRAAGAGLAAACVVEAAGLGLAWTVRLAAGTGAGRVLRGVARVAGPGTFQAAACAAAAGVLIVYAFVVLGRAGVHCFAASAADLPVPPDQENR